MLLCLVTYSRIKEIWVLMQLRGIVKSGFANIERYKFEVACRRRVILAGIRYLHLIYEAKII